MNPRKKKLLNKKTTYKPKYKWKVEDPPNKELGSASFRVRGCFVIEYLDPFKHGLARYLVMPIPGEDEPSLNAHSQKHVEQLIDEYAEVLEEELAELEDLME